MTPKLTTGSLLQEHILDASILDDLLTLDAFKRITKITNDQEAEAAHALYIKQRLAVRNQIKRNIQEFSSQPLSLQIDTEDAEELDEEEEDSQVVQHPESRKPTRPSIAPTKRLIKLDELLELLENSEEDLQTEVDGLNNELRDLKVELSLQLEGLKTIDLDDQDALRKGQDKLDRVRQNLAAIISYDTTQ